MLIKSNTSFKVEDFYETKDGIVLLSNMKPDFDILRNSKTLEVDKKIKTAKVIKIAPKESDFLYVRNRAVSAGNVIEKDDNFAELIPIDEMYKWFERYADKIRGANDNGDFFSHEELIKNYKTFIGKSVFVDHDNDNVEKARGIILDAVYNPNGKFVELLKAVDKKAFPELSRGVEMGYITDTSMGCRCGYSICSICGNSSVSEDDFCDHILYYKGSTYNGLPVFEDNRDIEFFEDSFVTTGADKDAKILEKVASRHRGSSPIITTHNTTKRDMSRITNEINQRSRHGKITTMVNDLSNLPWN